MANKDKEPLSVANNYETDLENLKRRLEMLDRRLDDIDSAISAIVERVMKQPITINMTCPKCGKNIEIAIIGNPKITP